MANVVDSRVVEMLFKSSDFQRGVANTLKALENLKKASKLEGASAGLDELQKKASGLNVSGLQNGLTAVAGKFSALKTIGVGALLSIGATAASVGARMVQSLALGPLRAGLQEYETNLNSIQTILANTGLEGRKGLDQVNSALEELNHYSDQTIYNFSEMARNIGTFTAAGIKLEPATAAIKGIANLAAISGSNAEQASSAMYQLSQAMAAGKATLVDWNSVVNAGMGGKVFQEALKETARVQGVAVDDIIKKNGSFRDSLQEGWLTTEVLTETLAKFTGDLTASQLKSMGYNEQQIKGIMKMGKTAQDAATKVKTVSQLINTLQEAAGSGWSKTFQILFGDFEEARSLFTNVNNVLGGFISKSADARNKVLGDWKALGGRTVLIQGIAIAFNNVMEVLTPIGKAFRDIFPPMTGKRLFELTQGFTKLMGQMRLGEDTMDNIRRTFRGLFAIFSIGLSVLKGVGTVLKTVFSSFSDGSSGILEFTGGVGDWLVALDQAIKKGEGFQNFFKGVGKAIVIPIQALKSFIGFIGDLISGMGKLDGGGIGDRFQARFAPLAKLGGAIGDAFAKLLDIIGRVGERMQPIFDIFEAFFEGLADKIENGFSSVDYNNVLDGINTGLFAGLVLLIRKFLNGDLLGNLGGGFLEKIGDAFDGLTGVLGAMQAQLKANALLKIAGAIALLTASVVALSLIDPKKLTSAMTGLTAMFTQLLIAMSIFGSITSSAGFLKMPILTTALIGMAIAIDLLAIAVSKLAKLNWEELAKGLTGTAVLLGSLALFTKFSGTNAVSGVGLILLAGAILLLVKAAEQFGGMSWGTIAKGLVGVAGMLTALALFTKFSVANKGGIAQGAGLLLLAAAVKVLADAMQDLGKLSWTEIGKGLVTMAGGLALMAGALALVPPSSVLSAAGIFIVAASLGRIGDAVQKMGGLSWGEIARGLTAMAGALTAISLAIGLLPPSSLLSAAAIFVTAASLGMIAKALGTMGGMSWTEIAKSLIVLSVSLGLLAASLYLMTGALPGAAALIVAAGAIALLVPALQALGSMSWGELLKSLVGLAAALTLVGIAGLVLGPISPLIAALGIAVTLLGVGALAAGLGVLAFATALQLLAVSGVAGAAALVVIVGKMLGILPMVAKALGDAVIAFAIVISKAAPAITAAITTVLLSLMNAIIRLTPKISQTLGVLLDTLIALLRRYVPKLVSAGADIVIAILKGLAQKVPQMVTAATDVIVAFLKGVKNNMPRVIQAGVDLIIGFVHSVADAIRNNSAAMGAAGADLGMAIVEGMIRGIGAGAGRVAEKAKGLALSAWNAAKGALESNSPSKKFIRLGEWSGEGMAIGFVKSTRMVAKAADDMGNESIEALRKSISGISDVVTTDANFNPIIRPVLDLTDVKNQASQIGSILTPTPIRTDEVLALAKSVSAEISDGQQARQEAQAGSTTTVNYTQNNTSPKALSSAEIYRNTKSQLSTKKGALDR